MAGPVGLAKRENQLARFSGTSEVRKRASKIFADRSLKLRFSPGLRDMGAKFVRDALYSLRHMQTNRRLRTDREAEGAGSYASETASRQRGRRAMVRRLGAPARRGWAELGMGTAIENRYAVTVFHAVSQCSGMSKGRLWRTTVEGRTYDMELL